MKRWMAAFAAAGLVACLGGCAAPALTQERVGQLAYAALGPEMQMGEQLLLVWIESPERPVVDPVAAAGKSPMVGDLAQAMARGAREPIHLGVGGPDSAYTAQVLLQALRAIPYPQLAGLRIAFIGQQADAMQLAPAMAAKGATLHFEPPTR